ncbi:Uncharacterised protein [Campylobacter sputorum subsp. bubulus]|uniref:hypothetical protein n=1 Tax=Campylobacter sputorum TaxID=206 RepID=UPI000B796EA2|nr:hypothetical protein [Campylobacter sputorum]ASM37189.1 hypothetical protein CSF_1338 [Campylobacter sputorum bv. faecalis CCUG 20703]ASM38855.1 hypothetical protein CSPARA_1308 [Campylobacter sputorum bv. paraureolyticus LMG 11764]MDY6121094.1 hypothetical protein [Campylobacter sputorum]SUX08352.1 Uncharacterised protein [Campylobacter sputorum subsp. bubulus]
MKQILLIIFLTISLNAENQNNPITKILTNTTKNVTNLMFLTDRQNVIKNIQNIIIKNHSIKSEHKFGDNIEIVGKWHLKIDGATNFLLGAGFHNYDIDFKRDHRFIKDGYKNWFWRQIDDNNIIIFEKGFENKFIMHHYYYDILKIKKRLENGCFLVISKNDLDIEMCKKEAPIFVKGKAPIKIEIVK